MEESKSIQMLDRIIGNLSLDLHDYHYLPINKTFFLKKM